MGQGKWYLVWTYWSYDSGLGHLELTEVPLMATAENEAVAEARAKWAEIPVEATVRFGDISPNPQVVYKIALR